MLYEPRAEIKGFFNPRIGVKTLPQSTLQLP